MKIGRQITAKKQTNEQTSVHVVIVDKRDQKKTVFWRSQVTGQPSVQFLHTAIAKKAVFA